MSAEITVFRLKHDTVHEIHRETDIPVEMLMTMLWNAEEYQLEYHIVKPARLEENWIPDDYWRVVDPFGKVVHYGSNLARLRAVLMDGYTLERHYACPAKSMWKKVDE